MNPDRLLTVPQAAQRLACSRWHIYDLVNAGKLDRRYGGTNGRTLRLSESDVHKYIDSIKAAPLPATKGTH